MAESPRILIARPDRLGDVLLSTPVASVLKEHYPQSKITFLVRDFVAPVLKGVPSIDEVLVYEPLGRHRGLGGFFRLMEELKERDFQIAIQLQSQLRIAAAVYGVGIPHRLGPLSKPHSFLFLNRGIRQRRSQVEMHEADYNLQLLRKLGIRVQTREFPTQASVDPELKAWAAEWLRARGYVPQAPDSPRLIVVHPGMGGSALNWPEPHYVELIALLRREGHAVLVAGGPEEGGLLQRVDEELKRRGTDALFFGGGEAKTLAHLSALLSHAHVVVAPSTGPLHLAVAIGRPVVTLFPPVRVQSAIRWGPYRPDEERASVLVPENYCGEDYKCRGSVCHYYPCMKSVVPTQALEEVHRQLKENP